MVLAPPNSGFLRDPVADGAGYDYFSDNNAPDDVLRLWRAGEQYPRIVIVPATGHIYVGNGLAYPSSDIVIVPSGINAVDVAFEPNGTIAATNVQAAIQEVRDEAGSGSGSGVPPGGSTNAALLKNSNADGDADWRLVTTTLIGAAAAGDLTAEQVARANGDATLAASIAAIVSGGGTGDMLLADALFGIDATAARFNLGLGTAAPKDVGISANDVAAGDAPQAAVDAMPTVDFDQTLVPDDPTLNADFTTVANVTKLRGGKLATLDDIGVGGASYTAVVDDAAYSMLATDRYVEQSGTLTADKVIPLALAADVAAGTRVTIANASATTPSFSKAPGAGRLLTWAAQGGDIILNEADFANTGSIIMREPLGVVELRSNGSNIWIVVSHSLHKPLLYWQHPRRVATPGDGTPTPVPWNAAVSDLFGMSPGLEGITCTIAATSDGLVLPQGTLHCDTAGGVSLATLGFPAVGYIVCTGPPKMLTGVASDPATDTFTKTAHGLVDGDRIKINGLSNTTGISVLTEYIVRDATANTFKIRLVPPGGATAINLTGAADASLIVWAEIDTVIGYTSLGGTGGKDFLGCNTATSEHRAGISTGTLKTGMLISGANVLFTVNTPYLYALTACIAYEGDAFGIRNCWLTDGSSNAFVVTKGNDQPALDMDGQMVSVTSQPGLTLGQYAKIEAVQTSGRVLNLLNDGISSLLLMMAHLTT